MYIINSDEVLSVLQGFNPWWVGKHGSDPQFKRLAYKACLKYLENIKLRRAILLSGPRRVGKTTILLQLAQQLIREGRNPKSIIYISLDHPILKIVSLRKVLELYHQTVYGADEPSVLLLDEIHYSKDWESEIKLLIDHKPNYRIIATGSASSKHKHDIAESGVGRWITIPTPTLSFYEFIHIRNEDLHKIDENLKLSDIFNFKPQEFMELGTRFNHYLPLFQRYLLVGGFPETANLDDLSLCQRLLREDVVERVLKRDMTALFGVRSIAELEKLFIYLFLHTGQMFSNKACADALETSTTTIANHLIHLEQANLIYRLSPAGISGKSILRARNKYYLVDAALRNAVLLKGEEVLANADEMGMVIETTILRHLYAYYYRDTPQILYWRDAKTQKEVDIIVTSPSYNLPFEIKYKEQAKLTEDSGLAIFCEKEKNKNAYFVTKNTKDFGLFQIKDVKTNFLKIPAHILCYLLGQAERLLWS